MKITIEATPKEIGGKREYVDSIYDTACGNCGKHNRHSNSGGYAKYCGDKVGMDIYGGCADSKYCDTDNVSQ